MRQCNKVWDPGVSRSYLWLDKAFIVVLFNIRLNIVIISVDKFTGATFLHRVIWDLRIQLIGGL